MTQRAQITDPENIKAFVLGGRATFTLRSARTGTRYTYRVKLAPKRKSGTPALRPLFVSVLNAQDNNHDYQYIGCIWLDNFGFCHSARSLVHFNAPSVQAFKWF